MFPSRSRMQLRQLDLTKAGFPLTTLGTSKYAVEPIPSSARSGELANYYQTAPTQKVTVRLDNCRIFSASLNSQISTAFVVRRLSRRHCATI